MPGDLSFPEASPGNRSREPVYTVRLPSGSARRAPAIIEVYPDSR